MAMGVQFDTLRYIEKLKTAGIHEAQAKAKAEALAMALGESASGLLPTPDEITSLRLELADRKSELKLMKWMVVPIVVGVVSLVAAAYFS